MDEMDFMDEMDRMDGMDGMDRFDDPAESWGEEEEKSTAEKTEGMEKENRTAKLRVFEFRVTTPSAK